MDFNDYQAEARKLDIYPKDNRIIGHTLGLAGESGEVAEKVKKHLRGDNIPTIREDIANELGDVLWYLSNLACDLNYSLEEVAELNIKKLKDRKARNVQRGQGDKR